LSGGGARGLAQIGVLKVLDEAGIPIDGIVGTSIGAIIGGLYASGYSAADLETAASRIDWKHIMQDAPTRDQLFLGQKEEASQFFLEIRLHGLSFSLPSAYTSGQNLTRVLTDLILAAPSPITDDFDQMAVPFRAVATDILTGRKMILSRGSLVEAMRASMAIPLLFTPIRWGDALLVDGGLVQNLPVTEAKGLGFDRVIAVDTSSKLAAKQNLDTPWIIADQATTIMHQGKIAEQLALADLAIQPELENVGNMDYEQFETIVRSGEEAARRFLPIMRSWAVEDSSGPVYSIRSLVWSGADGVRTGSLDSLVSFTVPGRIASSEIARTGRRIYDTGLFSKTSARIDTASGSLVYELEANPVIRGIRMEGNRAVSDSTLLSALGSRTGDRLNLNAARADWTTIRRLYLDKGFALAKVDTALLRSDTLVVRIDEGRIGRVRFMGNQRIKPFILSRDLPKPGEYFNVSVLREGIENIYGSGFFQNVYFDVEEHPGTYDLVVHVTERGTTLIRTGIRHDLERRTQGILEIALDNVFGGGGKSAWYGLWGDRDRATGLWMRIDRIFDSYVTFKAGVSLQNREYDFYSNGSSAGLYDKASLSGYAAVGQQMQRLGTLWLQLGIERVHLNPLAGVETPKARDAIRNLTIRSEVDTRDTFPFPHSGKYHILEYETANAFFGSGVSYTKLGSSMESYYPWSGSVTFHPRLAWGTADANTPFYKQFRLGGLDQFMGLPENAWVGKRYLTVNLECRFRVPVPGWFDTYASVRYDFGGIWEQYSKILNRDFKQGRGFVLAFATPAGPVEFGMGWADRNKPMVYLSAGYSF
jgi:NTE family protein